MIKVTKVMTTETAHRLIDYKGKCASIHGHSYRWEVTAVRKDCSLDDRGMVIDFSDLKKAMKNRIYDIYDHALVLCDRDPLATEFGRGPLLLASDDTLQKIFFTSFNPTAENFARDVGRLLNEDIIRESGGLIRVTKVKVWETSDSYGEWERKN